MGNKLGIFSSSNLLVLDSKTHTRLLHAIGFTQQEIKKLLLHPETSNNLPMSVLIDFSQIVGEKFGGDVEAFCETLGEGAEPDASGLPSSFGFTWAGLT